MSPQDQFDSFVNTLAKESKADANAKFYKPGDLYFSSHIPFGIRTGLPQIELALGRPGWPAGRIVELYGFAMVGKTTLGYHAISNVQKMGGMGVVIDTELTFDEDRATTCGVDVKGDFAYFTADTVEAYFRTIERVLSGLRSSEYSKPVLIMVDSVTGALVESEKVKEFGAEPRVGIEAKVIRAGLKKIIPDLADTKACLLLINHAVSIIAMTKWARNRQAAGGHAIKLLASARAEFRNTGKIKDPNDKEKELGQKIKILFEKSKIGSLYYPIVDTELLFECGFNTVASLLEAMKTTKMIISESEARKGTYTFRQEGQEDITFIRKEWPGLIESFGGVDKMYDYFIETCISTGIIKPY